jgi:hydrogenase maturation protein HypF
MPRRAITVSGVVQGVGFRPFVYGLASKHRLSGFVRNRVGTVEIEVEGPSTSLDDFLYELEHSPPALAMIDRLLSHEQSPVGDREFCIEHSYDGAEHEIYLSPDVATCPDCLAELFNPLDRRYRYPFINCTNCGPRLTIIRAAPYDRLRTTMSDFAMCAACRQEYEDPRNRRFHAEPIACPICGPQLQLRDAIGNHVDSSDPLAAFVEVIRRGGIGALKGLGGYHLVCDARDDRAVAELRRRKHRDEKPFAIMIRDLFAAERLCHVTDEQRHVLEQPARPIVLLRKNRDSTLAAISLSEAVAPGNPYLGVMLPYTPLHHLLLDAMDRAPLVMTSGNRSDEPIAYLDDDAAQQLADIADIFLGNNRPIHARCDDSIVKPLWDDSVVLRRSRGYAPRPITLPFGCERELLSVGGQLKNVFALSQNDRAILSQHMGDLDHFEGYRQFERDIRHYERLFRLSPEWIVHDLHPDYASTQYAIRRAKELGVPRLAVQHHHAHMASCMAENGLDEPVIGVTFDGTGYGVDERTGKATIWGGEFLVGDYRQFCRAAHLRNVPLPGGDRAIREPWRTALSHLRDADCDVAPLRHRIAPVEFQTVERMLDRRFNSPQTSSVGRLFDAVAALIDIRDRVSYEGQAAMELEWLADGETDDGSPYPFVIEEPTERTHPIIIDTRPIIRAVVDDVHAEVPAARIARQFHSTIVALTADTCGRLRKEFRINVATLSGGVFMNSILTTEITARLTADGFRVYTHRHAPPNDGGISLGQLAVAAATINAANKPAGDCPNFVTSSEQNGTVPLQPTGPVDPGD